VTPGDERAAATGGPVGPGPFSDADAEDYRVLRETVGAVTVERDVLGVSGPDARSYLQGQLSQDVEGLAVGASADSLLLSPQGKLDALVRVSRLADTDFVVDVEGGFGDATAARLERFKLRVKVVVERLPWHCVSLRGPGAAALARGGPPGGWALAPGFSWNGVDGVDLLGEGAAAPPGVRVCETAAWQSVRVEAGIPVMGAELDARTIAAEADLLERAVSFTKGCYTGQELVARLDARGNRVVRHLRGLVLDEGAGPVAGRVGAEVVVGDKVVGAVTSTAWSPATRRWVALAYVHRAVEPPARVEVRAPEEGVVGAEVRVLPLV